MRGLNAERLPQSYLALRLHVAVSYHNAGSRPLILPLERDRAVYTALKPVPLAEFKENFGLFDSPVKAMTELPTGVSPDNPTIPKNYFFTLIPAGGDMSPPLSEEITLPVSRKGVFRKYPDLRGHTVYVQLQFAHRKLATALEANLSDRWSRFGVPWTGTLKTNTIQIDVPMTPAAAGPCVDSYTPAHRAIDDELTK